MKPNYLPKLLVFLCLIIISCQNDEYIPLGRSFSIDNIRLRSEYAIDATAHFDGEIEDVNDYGFQLGRKTETGIIWTEGQFSGNKPDSREISSILEYYFFQEGERYSVRPVLQIEGKYEFGDSFEFLYQEAFVNTELAAPRIDSISPRKFIYNERITIHGSNFSSYPDYLQLTLDGKNISIESIENDKITLRFRKFIDFVQEGSELKIKQGGFESNSFSDFEPLAPVLDRLGQEIIRHDGIVDIYGNFSVFSDVQVLLNPDEESGYVPIKTPVFVDNEKIRIELQARDRSSGTERFKVSANLRKSDYSVEIPYQKVKILDIETASSGKITYGEPIKLTLDQVYNNLAIKYESLLGEILDYNFEDNTLTAIFNSDKKLQSLESQITVSQGNLITFSEQSYRVDFIFEKYFENVIPWNNSTNLWFSGDELYNINNLSFETFDGFQKVEITRLESEVYENDYYGHIAIGNEQYIYFGLGTVRDSNYNWIKSNKIYRFDLVNDSWMELPDFDGELTNYYTATLEGEILYVCTTNGLYSYSEVSGWTQLVDLKSHSLYVREFDDILISSDILTFSAYEKISEFNLISNELVINSFEDDIRIFKNDNKIKVLKRGFIYEWDGSTKSLVNPVRFLEHTSSIISHPTDIIFVDNEVYNYSESFLYTISYND